jgi:hypothetical protein
METFKHLPIEDIHYFLVINNLPLLDNDDDNYLEAYKLILLGQHTGVAPISIYDWVIAQNTQSSPKRGRKSNPTIKKKLPVNTTSNKLPRGLRYTNMLPGRSSTNILPEEKESSTNILQEEQSYMNVLSEEAFINILPEELIYKILTDVECDEILAFCRTNKQYESYCVNNYKNILQDNLEKKFGFLLNNYSLEELLILCKFYNKNKEYFKSLAQEEIEILIHIQMVGGGAFGYIINGSFYIFEPFRNKNNLDLRKMTKGKNCNKFTRGALIRILSKLYGKDDQKQLNEYLSYERLKLCSEIKRKITELGLLVGNDDRGEIILQTNFV